MEKTMKNICVFGLGGVGGYIGGMMTKNLLQSSQAHHQVYFIARGKHLEAIQEKGLTFIMSSGEKVTCHPTKATDTVVDLPVMDYIFLCVKGYDLEEALESIRGIAGENTVIIAPLNGVDIYERIKPKMAGSILLPSCTFVTSSITEPGTVLHKGGTTLVVLGNDPQKPEYNPSDLHSLLRLAEIPFRWEEDALTTIWEKFIMFAPFALVTGYSAKTFGQVMEDDALKGLVRSIMEEVVALAKAKGIPVKDAIIDTYLGNAGFYPYETKTSYQRDLESGKGKDEGDLIGGAIIRLGKEYGISTAITESVYQRKR